ncbi:MAG: toxin HicA [bacterium]|nr:toxin HicA [bacterium]
MTRERLEKLIEELERSQQNTRFDRLVTICTSVFGQPQKSRRGGSHLKFHTPWMGDPRINLQRIKGGKAKAYQVDQVLAALRHVHEAEQ